MPHEADWIRKQRRGIQRGVLISSAVDPAGIPAVRVAGSANPRSRRNRPLGTANQAVKDTLSVPNLNRSFSGFSYGFQHPWPDQRPLSSSEAGAPCVNAHAGICAGGRAQACSLPRCLLSSSKRRPKRPARIPASLHRRPAKMRPRSSRERTVTRAGSERKDGRELRDGYCRGNLHCRSL